jgi:hypothetical protein
MKIVLCRKKHDFLFAGVKEKVIFKCLILSHIVLTSVIEDLGAPAIKFARYVRTWRVKTILDMAYSFYRGN